MWLAYETSSGLSHKLVSSILYTLINKLQIIGVTKVDEQLTFEKWKVRKNVLLNAAYCGKLLRLFLCI